MARSQSGTACGAPTKNNGPCSLPADTCPHESHARWREAKSQDGGGTDTDARDMPEREWWREHADTLAALAGAESQDGVPMETTLGRAWAKRADVDTREAYRRIFGACPVETCENGQNGFEASTCAKHEGEHPDAGGESPDGETISVDVDGRTVTGTPAEVRALLDQ